MFNKVLVGIDGQTRGRDAIALARQLANTDSEITFGHIYPPVVSARNVTGDSPKDAGAATELLRAVASEWGMQARTRCAPSVSISDGLRTVAEQIDADLLVIGGTTRNRMTRALLGNFTAETLATAACTVAIAPLDYAQHPHEIHRVGVAYDGSYPSEDALDVAQAFAESIDADVSAFKIVRPPHDAIVGRRHQLERAVQALQSGRRQIEAHPGVQALVAYGKPVEQLSGFSNTVDVMVAGARGAGFLARLLHPSTTQALADAVKCPLIVVTKPARQRAHAYVSSTGEGTSRASVSR